MVDNGDKVAWYKKIPITFLLAVFLQTVGLVSWAARFEERTQFKLEDLDRRMLRGEMLDDRYSSSTADLCQRLARVEEKLGAQLSASERIEALVRDHTNMGTRR